MVTPNPRPKPIPPPDCDLHKHCGRKAASIRFGGLCVFRDQRMRLCGLARDHMDYAEWASMGGPAKYEWEHRGGKMDAPIVKKSKSIAPVARKSAAATIEPSSAEWEWPNRRAGQIINVHVLIDSDGNYQVLGGNDFDDGTQDVETGLIDSMTTFNTVASRFCIQLEVPMPQALVNIRYRPCVESLTTK